MPLVSKKISNPASKIAAMTLNMDEIASMAVSAALDEIRCGDGARSGGRDPTKKRVKWLSRNSYRAIPTHDSPYSVTDSSCSVSTLSYDDFSRYNWNNFFSDFTEYDWNDFFSTLREKFCCGVLIAECKSIDAVESRDEKGLTSDRLADSYPSRDGITILLDTPRVLFSDTGSIYSIGSKYDEGTSTTVKGGLKKKGGNWELWTAPGPTSSLCREGNQHCIPKGLLKRYIDVWSCRAIPYTLEFSSSCCNLSISST